jgi:hypothetical protein
MKKEERTDIAKLMVVYHYFTIVPKKASDKLNLGIK